VRLTRRAVLAAAAALAGCGRTTPPPWDGGWVGADAARGHRLRSTPKSGHWPAPAVRRRADVLVIGAGVAGLAAARALVQGGIHDVQLLELEDTPGGNSRGHTVAGMACPLGAHYLPVPGPQAHEVSELLHELGLLRMDAGRVVADERHLCHSPQERLFHEGVWIDGLLPPAEPGSATLAQYRRFSALVAQAQRDAGFSIPTARAGWHAAHAVLDGQSFARWLAAQGLHDERLRWYLDYCCRDDYGAGADTVSAWAGLHYFASRHGFHAPGDEEAEREPVFTWPEGNAWLARRLAAPLAERLHTGRTVLRVSEERHAVQVWAHDERTGQVEAWTAAQVVLALPPFIAARVLHTPPAALAQAAQQQPRAPWLVANLHLAEPLLDRAGGAAPSWDNVRYGGDPRALGYVDAMHQSTRPHPGPTVLTVYWALPIAERRALLEGDWRGWAQRVVADLAVAHPDLPAKLRRADLMRYGHAMGIPVPGLRGSPALAALHGPAGRLHFAHADLAGYSVFEEAFSSGTAVGRRIAQAAHRN
jgi:monoamine oxidase